MLTFRDTNKSFKLDGDLLKTMTNYNFNVDQYNPLDRKIVHELRKEMKFDFKAIGRKSPIDKYLVKLPKSPAIMAGSLKKKSSSKTKTQNLKNPKQYFHLLILMNYVIIYYYKRNKREKILK